MSAFAEFVFDALCERDPDLVSRLAAEWEETTDGASMKRTLKNFGLEPFSVTLQAGATGEVRDSR